MVARRLACAFVARCSACAHHHRRTDGDDDRCEHSEPPMRAKGCAASRSIARREEPAADDDLRHGVRAERNAAAVRRERLRAGDRSGSARRRRARAIACSDGLPGGALAADDHRRGRPLQLDERAGDDDVPLVIQVGKWRRQIMIPNVAACQDAAAATPSTRRCRRADRHDAEHDERRHAADRDHDRQRRRARVPRPQARHRRQRDHDRRAGRPRSTCSRHVARQGRQHVQGRLRRRHRRRDSRTATTTLWGDVDDARRSTTSCSCRARAVSTRRRSRRPRCRRCSDYADLGGRVFMSHWHNIWIGGEQGDQATHGIPTGKPIATCDFARQPEPRHADRDDRRGRQPEGRVVRDVDGRTSAARRRTARSRRSIDGAQHLRRRVDRRRPSAGSISIRRPSPSTSPAR